MSRLLVPQTPIEQLARQPPPEVTLTREERDRIAHLAMAITQESNRRGGSLIDQVPYPERTEEQRAASRLAVTRIVQAMHMLGYLDPP
jgi:hypothetical protein